MARRRYFRYYKRTVPKKKWASNLRNISLGQGAPFAILVENKVQIDAPTPTIIKTGNFKVQGDAAYQTSSGTEVDDARKVLAILYILFVPEGWADVDIMNIPTQHPEWIMGWSVIDIPYVQQFGSGGGNKFSMTSRLKRNLNSGDKVVAYLAEEGTETRVVALNGIAQYWTCAN